MIQAGLIQGGICEKVKLILLSMVLVLMSVSTNGLSAQSSQDSVEQEITIEKEKKGSIFSGRPGKSLLFSLIVPGAGQIYNKSYLRVPFVWAAVGGVGYILVKNTRSYTCLRDAYVARIDMVPHVLGKHCDPNIDLVQDAARIRRFRDEANSNRQLAIVGFTLVWLANGVDAFVDAHLKEFDIDEDLSIEIGPKMDTDPYAPMRMGIFVQF